MLAARGQTPPLESAQQPSDVAVDVADGARTASESGPLAWPGAVGVFEVEREERRTSRRAADRARPAPDRHVPRLSSIRAYGRHWLGRTPPMALRCPGQNIVPAWRPARSAVTHRARRPTTSRSRTSDVFDSVEACDLSADRACRWRRCRDGSGAEAGDDRVVIRKGLAWETTGSALAHARRARRDAAGSEPVPCRDSPSGSRRAKPGSAAGRRRSARTAGARGPLPRTHEEGNGQRTGNARETDQCSHGIAPRIRRRRPEPRDPNPGNVSSSAATLGCG